MKQKSAFSFILCLFLQEYGADMKRLLIINNQDSFTYNLVDMIRRLAVPFDVVNVQELDVDEVANYSHILISPGPDVPRAYPQLFAMLERYHQSKSILGVCLGHQTLCEFFGGELYNLDKVRHGALPTPTSAVRIGLVSRAPP